jgi:predicted nucleic acid-binding protein
VRTIFVDTNYWVALINPKDQGHETARECQAEIGVVRLVTTESVLIEVLNYFAEGRSGSRLAAAKLAASLLNDPDVETVPHSHQVFLAALAYYEARPDKGYSLTDCISMNAMRERDIADVLTHDAHFAQEGFHILL